MVQSASSSPDKQQSAPFGAVLVGIGAYYLALEFGPIISGPVINWKTALCALVCAICATQVVVYLLDKTAEILIWISVRLPKGHNANARWASWWDLRKDVLLYGFGPYWGYHKPHWWSSKRAIFADFFSNCALFGTAGSGKGVGCILPNILAIRASKLLPDFKGVNSLMVKEALQKRGERFVCLNIGNMYPDQLPTDYYNPQNVMAENFITPGGLKRVVEDVEKITMQLYPEADEARGDSKFWEAGTRLFLAMSQLQNILIFGMDSTFGHASQTINNQKDFLRQMQWAAGTLQVIDDEGNSRCDRMPIEQSHWCQYHEVEDVENFITFYRGKAAAVADLLSAQNSKVAEAFLSAAQIALAPFNITTHAHTVLSKTTFRFREMKQDKPVTVSIAIDATRLETQTTIAGLLQTCALIEFQRSQNTKPVYVIADECTNYKLSGLTKLLTFGREYGIRLFMVIQSLSAFKITYGDKALGVLLSETEIKMFLPHTREPETLDLIEKLLGEQAYIHQNHNAPIGEGIKGYGLNEQACKLMNADKIRRSKKAILFIRNNRPALVTVPPYAAIYPWKHQVGINPFFGKAYKKWTVLHIGSRRMPFVLRLIKWLRGGMR
ncbi:MAG: type IV secretory system conjugative DNA transfer family protein [Pseudomonadota bacterium]